MMAGLGWTAWLLMAASVGIGLALVLLFFAAHRDDAADGDG
ncbi:MAG TPA: hypothetical protein VK928_03820 [Longimicrobiales bacterium]|nr:hypothetical protein [Longimicrobiales bacterium]